MKHALNRFLQISGIILCVFLMCIFLISIVIGILDIPTLSYPLTMIMPLVCFYTILVMLFNFFTYLISLTKDINDKTKLTKAIKLLPLCIIIYFVVDPINKYIQFHNISYMPDALAAEKYLVVAAVFAILATIKLIIVLALREINKSPEQRWEEKNISHSKRMAEKLSLQSKHYESGKIIVAVKLLPGNSTEYKSGSLGGAIIGGFLGGTIGAVIGATIPKKSDKTSQKFAIKYSDGRVEIKDVHPNSWEYKELMKYVKWEEINP